MNKYMTIGLKCKIDHILWKPNLSCPDDSNLSCRDDSNLSCRDDPTGADTPGPNYRPVSERGPKAVIGLSRKEETTDGPGKSGNDRWGETLMVQVSPGMIAGGRHWFGFLIPATAY